MSSGPVEPRDGSDPHQYYPYTLSVGANAFFMSAFYVMAIIFLWQGIRARSWIIYLLAAFALSEAGGYTARLVFALASYGSGVFNIFLAQLIIIIIAPNLVQAYLYAVVCKLIYWSDISPMRTIKKRAKWVPIVFIVLDFLCLTIQSIGGGRLSNQSNNADERAMAQDIMLAGLGAQVGCLFIFVGVTVWFFVSCPVRQQRQIKWVLGSLATGMLLVVIRNVYRMVEFSEGSFTEGALSQDEAYFFAADSMLMLLTCAVFAIFDVGRYLPVEALRATNKTSLAQGQIHDVAKAYHDADIYVDKPEKSDVIV